MNVPPPRTIPQQNALVPVVSKLKEAYLAWQAALPHVAKAKRQTIAARIDAAILDALELAFRAEYLPPAEKVGVIGDSINRLDVAKFLLVVGWECNAITNGQYDSISGILADVSKMLVGWHSYLEKKTPAIGSGRK